MRPAVWTFIILFSLFVTSCIFIAFSDIEHVLRQEIKIDFRVQDPAPIFSLKIWSVDFWLLVALIVSELAPFVPGKTSGIIHGISRALLQFFRRT